MTGRSKNEGRCFPCFLVCRSIHSSDSPTEMKQVAAIGDMRPGYARLSRERKSVTRISSMPKLTAKAYSSPVRTPMRRGPQASMWLHVAFRREEEASGVRMSQREMLASRKPRAVLAFIVSDEDALYSG